MDLDDVLNDDERCNKVNQKVDKVNKESKEDSTMQLEIELEDERSNGDRTVYINRELIFSNRYIDAIKSLGENRYCSKNILDASRTMLDHHHGDKYEDLYFIDSATNKMLARTDYKIREQEVLPTKAMIQMAIGNSNIICVHNHPTNALPSFEDIKTCYLVGYKYGLVVCHDGNIFQYKTLNDINQATYESECFIYYKREHDIAERFDVGLLSREEFEIEHQKNFIKLANNLVDAGVILKEVLWNGKPQL